MADGIDQAADAFSVEIAPPTRPRDQAGKFVQTVDQPEPMFSEREVEGGSDAGEDTRRRSKEVEVRRGRETDRDDVYGAKSESPQRIGARDADGGEEGDLTDEERAVVEADEVSERKPRDDEDEKYEVVVDGHPQVLE